ncbi:MAG: hydroxyethylthiazole kinase [Bacillota bacterium]|nr:hydroxyethylthiazole kinase [Bacillota bacterium]
MLKEMLKNLREKAPLIHNITNYVTVNDCANVLLACGASPIMSDDPEEVEEICALCAGLNINIGTLNRHSIPAMRLAGRKANALGRPLVLDPVGAGASRLRTECARELLQELRISLIRGNISEVKSLALGSGSTRGVDADLADQLREETLPQALRFAREFSRSSGAILAITGPIDIVCDGERAFCIRNGHPLMSRITGSGCQLSAMSAAFLAANPEQPLEAAVAAVCAMGLCGEKAFSRMGPLDGNASYRNYIIDAIYKLQPEELEAGARWELA